MPTYEFECPKHGVFEAHSRHFNPPKDTYCEHTDKQKRICGRVAKRILSIPGGIIVEGGTNAGRAKR